MPRYRKKPIVVEAVQWHALGDHPKVVSYTTPSRGPRSPLCSECGAPLAAPVDPDGWEQWTHGWVATLEGGHIVCPGDFIITGVKGEHYPCKPDIFEASYDPVEGTG